MQHRAVRFTKVAILTAAVAVVAIVWATPTPPVARSGAPGETTCSDSSCHGGAGSASVVTSSTSGMTTYTPGVSKHFTVTVSGSGGNAGFELTARPASNLSGGVAGNLVAGAGAQVVCLVGSACGAGNPQYIRSVSATGTPATFNFDWTPPSGTEDVTLYVAGAVGYTGSTSGATYLLKASTGTPPPAFSVAPGSLSFSYQIGGAAAATRTLTIGGVATTYTAVASGGAWLSVSPASGGTSGAASVSVNTTGLTAGTYNGSVVVTATGTTGSPITVPVALSVTPAAAALTVSPASLAFALQTGSTAPAAQALSISGVATTYTVAASGGAWLSVSPTSGGTSGSASVSVNPTGLAVGSYSGAVTITAAGTTGSPKKVPVTLNVTATAPSLTVSPSSLNFAYRVGSGAPAPQSIAIGGSSVNYTATVSGGAWLSVAPASGTAPGSVSVSVNTAGLVAGTYTASVTVTPSGATGGPRTVAVNLTVTDAPPALQVTPKTLAFKCAKGNTGPIPYVLNLASSSTALDYTATVAGGWLSVVPASGSTPSTLFVSVNPTGLAAGTYNASITITSSNTAGGAQTVPVTLQVNSAGTNACLVDD